MFASGKNPTMISILKLLQACRTMDTVRFSFSILVDNDGPSLPRLVLQLSIASPVDDFAWPDEVVDYCLVSRFQYLGEDGVHVS